MLDYCQYGIGRFAAKREETTMWLLRIVTVAFFIIGPLWGKADAAGCPASLDARQALSHAEYDRLCMGGTGSVVRSAPHPTAVSGRPVQTRMVLDVPPGDPQVNQRWYALGDRTEARRAQHALRADQQGHGQWRDRDRSDQRWFSLRDRSALSWARHDLRANSQGHRQNLDWSREGRSWLREIGRLRRDSGGGTILNFFDR